MEETRLLTRWAERPQWIRKARTGLGPSVSTGKGAYDGGLESKHSGGIDPGGSRL